MTKLKTLWIAFVASLGFMVSANVSERVTGGCCGEVQAATSNTNPLALSVLEDQPQCRNPETR